MAQRKIGVSTIRNRTRERCGPENGGSGTSVLRETVSKQGSTPARPGSTVCLGFPSTPVAFMLMQAPLLRRSLEPSQGLEQWEASGVPIRCLHAARRRGGKSRLLGFCRSGRSGPCRSIPARNCEVRSGRRCSSARRYCGIDRRHGNHSD
jgi:hypothetical protein